MKSREALRADNLSLFNLRDPFIFNLLAGYRPFATLLTNEESGPDVAHGEESFYGGRGRALVAEQLEAFWQEPGRVGYYDITPKRFDKYAGPFLDNLLCRAGKSGIEFSADPVSNNSFYLVVFGIGLGLHLEDLIEGTSCHALLLVDYSPELLFHSLEVIDWNRVYSLIDGRPGGTVQFLIKESPQELALGTRHWMRATSPASVDGTMNFIHTIHPIIEKTAEILAKEADLILTALGNAEDESVMIRNAYATLSGGGARIYRRREGVAIDAPVFVIGSSPSLDDDIQAIKINSDRAIIVSCGSAIRPLLVNGIVPDFHVEVENIDVARAIEPVAAAQDISSVRLLCAVTVDRQILKFFNRITYFFRGGLSPFPLFSNNDANCLGYPDPGVVNAAFSFAQEIGAPAIYLFGNDMGVMQPTGRHHSQETYHYAYLDGRFEDEPYDIQVAANFGGQSWTSLFLYSCIDHLTLAARLDTGNRPCFNCSDGALIPGFNPLRAAELQLPVVPGGKEAVAETVFRDFETYSEEEFRKSWDDGRMLAAIHELLDQVAEVVSKTADFNDSTYLVRLTDILRKKDDRLSTAMALFFRGTIFQMLISFEYYLKRIAAPGERRTWQTLMRQEFAATVEILRGHAVSEIGSLSRGHGGGG